MLNEYVPFATGLGANTLSTAAYTAHVLRPIGHQPGIALAEVENTALRQTTVGVAGLAQFAADYGALDALDDGVPANFKAAFKSALDAIVAASQFWRPGDVKGTLVDAVPTGWLKANGAIVSRATYAALFAALGTTYGAGDGSTTFQLPDLRGEFLRGWDNGRGIDGARVLGSAQAGMLESHTHDLHVYSRSIDGIGDEGDDTVASASPGVSGFIDAAGGTETRPRNVAALWLIKT